MNDRADTERWHRADGVFTAALELPAGRRLAFVRERCAGDPDLLHEVEALLHAESGAGTFLDDAGGGVLADALVDALADDDVSGASGTAVERDRPVPLDRTDRPGRALPLRVTGGPARRGGGVSPATP